MFDGFRIKKVKKSPESFINPRYLIFPIKFSLKKRRYGNKRTKWNK